MPGSIVKVSGPLIVAEGMEDVKKYTTLSAFLSKN